MQVQGAGDPQGLRKPLELLFVGIGNTLAGDDGVGPVMLSELQQLLGSTAGIGFHLIAGDLYALWDLLDEAAAMVILDAVAGDEPGVVFEGKPVPRGFAASFHQSDAATVMKKLEALHGGDFPCWTIWGVTITPPETLGEGLSGPVRAAADRAVARLLALLNGQGLPVGGVKLVIGGAHGAPRITRLRGTSGGLP